MKSSKTKCVGILTAGGDCPGLNAAIRAIAKPAMHEYGMRVIGFLEGFRGLVENRTIHLDDKMVSGIINDGGTILGTSRDKPHKMQMGNKVINMTQAAIDNLNNLHIDCLVCLGGGGTQKNALKLANLGVNVITLPKTIDNDIWGTEISFGYDTATSIATEAIDRLHTTATSHHRIIVCEIMGHNAGWLALSSGIAGGADVILIPEIPYDLNVVAEYLKERRRWGKRFSIIAVAEGALSIEDAANTKEPEPEKEIEEPTEGLDAEPAYQLVQESIASRIARQLQEAVGVEARVTTLGHVQRGGNPTAFDRILSTRLGARTALMLAEGEFNKMVSWKNAHAQPVDLNEVAGKKKLVPPDDPMIRAARMIGTCMGDRL